MEANAQSKASHLTHKVGDLLARGGEMYFAGARDAVRMVGLTSYTGHKMVMGGVMPAMQAWIDMQSTLGSDLLGAMQGKTSLPDAMVQSTKRMRAGFRFYEMVHRHGPELFGSARFEGEQVLFEDDILRLSYMPPKGEPAGLAIFHAGGGLPYSDRLFRMLPEANLYGRFLERGIAVYAMELVGERGKVNYRAFTLERLIDSIKHLSDLAFTHNRQRKMILEGYCGHGMHALAYACALPEDAEAKFQAIATFVAPIDGTQCSELAEMSALTPSSLLSAEMALYKALGGYVPGDSMAFGIDMTLGTLFHKTPMGHFRMGFDKPELADVSGIDSLTASQKRDIAGAWWITHENSKKYPIATDLVSYANALFTKGIGSDGTIPYQYKGKQLSFADLRNRSSLRLFGFYGARDAMVPDRTAHCLTQLFGERYKHVVHLHAGHISYVLSPKSWDANNPRALKPNPIDVLLAHACERG